MKMTIILDEKLLNMIQYGFRLYYGSNITLNLEFIASPDSLNVKWTYDRG